MARVAAQGDRRPMADNPEAMADLRAILAARSPDYARADARLDTSGRALEDCLDELERAARRLLDSKTARASDAPAAAPRAGGRA